MVTMPDGYQEFEHLEFLEIWVNWIYALDQAVTGEFGLRVRSVSWDEFIRASAVKQV